MFAFVTRTFEVETYQKIISLLVFGLRRTKAFKNKEIKKERNINITPKIVEKKFKSLIISMFYKNSNYLLMKALKI